ncbi:MAG: TetR/AcrR family transcriptional regulator [Dehalococcoidia bacterium]
MPAPVVSVQPAAPVEDVRERIVNSAVRCFAEKGYAGTSLREIAAAARTTKPMIYYYFKSKEGLYISTLGDLLQEFADAIDRATQPDDAPIEKLRSFCDAYLRYFQSQEPHCAFVVREVFGLGADIMAEFGRNLDERVRRRMKRVLEEGAEAGIFRAEDVENSTIAIMGILTMFILRRIFGDVQLDREAAVAQVVDFYVAGLRVPDARTVETALR